jgi:hypothetical protein
MPNPFVILILTLIMLICPLFVLAVLTALFALFELTALFALAWRFEPTMVVVLRSLLYRISQEAFTFP